MLMSGVYSNHSQAEPITLHSYYIPGLVDDTESGVMVEMLNAISDHSAIQFELMLAPTRRVQHNFRNRFIFGYFPELDEHRPQQGNCRTSAFMKKKIITVVRKGESVIQSVADLEGKRVGAVMGYSYGKDIVENPKIELIRVDNDDTNLKKLLTHRIDVIVGDAHSTINSIKQSDNQESVSYDLDHPVSLLDVFFLFQDSKEGIELCERVSKSIDALQENGKLNRWFGYQ
jgi:hypothetical protein